MNKFEQTSTENTETSYPKEVEEIALRATEDPDIQQAIKKGALKKSKIEATKEVRLLLRDKYPEIKKLPERTPPKSSLVGVASNEFMIAKHIVDLLW